MVWIIYSSQNCLNVYYHTLDFLPFFPFTWGIHTLRTPLLLFKTPRPYTELIALFKWDIWDIVGAENVAAGLAIHRLL